MQPQSYFRLRPGNLVEIAKVIDAGKLAPVIDRILPLSEARRAHELSHQVTRTEKLSCESRTFRRCRYVETIEIHDFVPGRNKVVNELFLSVGTGIDFGQCAELRV